MLTKAHASILRLINQSGPLSRTELVGLLGVSKASMSMLTGELIGRGMLAEGAPVHGVGRPSVSLELAAGGTLFVGVSLATTPFIVCVTDLHGRLVAETEMECGREPAAIAREIARVIEDMFAGDVIGNGADRAKLVGIGVAIPGFVDAARGVCIRSTLLGWRDVPIGALIAEATGHTAYVENDANSLALGEHLFGSLRGVNSCALVSVGDGIGCGLILNGELHRGANGGAGEIAHATIEPGGQPCKCGKRGCLDTLSSINSIASLAAQFGLAGDLAGLDEAAERGNQDAIGILHRAGSALGLAASHLIQSLDPARIVVAVPDGPLDGLFGRVVRQTVDASVMASDARQIDLSVLRIGRPAWVAGAASVAAARGLFQL